MRRETLEVDALLADLDRAREVFEAAERRARTYLARRGVIDQTCGDLASLLRECLLSDCDDQFAIAGGSAMNEMH